MLCYSTTLQPYPDGKTNQLFLSQRTVNNATVFYTYMWKNNIIKLASKLNTRLNTTRVGNFKFVRGFKRGVRRPMDRLLIHGISPLIKINGLSIYIYPSISGVIAYVTQSFEPYTTKLFEQAIKPGAIVLDIGAQFGYFSLIAAKQVGQKGRVYAFEPVSANFQILVKNIQMNGYTDIIHATQKAVGDKLETTTIFIYEGSDSHSMYRDPRAEVKETALVKCVTVDKFLNGQSVDVIKMDIEGNEPRALEGMKQTILKSDNLVLFIEFTPDNLRHAGVKPKDYILQIEKLGFDVQLIDEHSQRLKPIAEALIMKNDPSWYANLYCTKSKINTR